jgi:hypothetical protein
MKMAVKTIDGWLMGFIGTYLFNAECLAIAAGLGFWRNSWWVFGIVIVVLMVAQSVKILAIPMAIVFSIAWGAAGFWVAGAALNRTDAQWVAGLFLGVLALSIHFHALNYVGMVDLDV